MTRDTPNSAMKALLAPREGLYSKMLASIGHVSSVQVSKADMAAVAGDEDMSDECFTRPAGTV